MGDNSHSSLPIEYQLNYGTACGNLDVTQFMNNAPPQCVTSPDSGLPEEKPLRIFWGDSGTFTVDVSNSRLIGLDRR